MRQIPSSTVLFIRENKLWCESTTNPVPVLRIAASRGFSELTRNWITSSHGHSAPSLKVSCKSVQSFSRNLANKETNKDAKIQRNRSKTMKTIYRGLGNHWCLQGQIQGWGHSRLSTICYLFKIHDSGRHLTYGMTECFMPLDTSERAPPQPSQ